MAAMHAKRIVVTDVLLIAQEATELSALFARVEVVFASGDLQRMAATLASIRRGLALVGAVPEFKGGRARLAVRAPPFLRSGSLHFNAACCSSSR